MYVSENGKYNYSIYYETSRVAGTYIKSQCIASTDLPIEAPGVMGSVIKDIESNYASYTQVVVTGITVLSAPRPKIYRS